MKKLDIPKALSVLDETKEDGDWRSIQPAIEVLIGDMSLDYSKRIQFVRQLLLHENAAVRIAVANALSNTWYEGDEEVRAALHAALADSSPLAKCLAARAIWLRHGPDVSDAIQTLADLMMHEAHVVSVNAVHSFSLTPNWLFNGYKTMSQDEVISYFRTSLLPNIMRAFANAIHHGTDDIKMDCIHSLGSMYWYRLDIKNCAEVIRMANEAITTGSTKTKSEVVEFLGGVGEEANRALLGLVIAAEDDDPSVKEAASNVLQALGVKLNKHTVDNIHTQYKLRRPLARFVSRKRSPLSEVTEVSRSHHLDALFNTVPDDAPFAVQAEEFASVNHEYRLHLAARLQPLLNAYLREHLPHDDLEGKKKLCDFVEKTLEPLGLAVKTPNTSDRPAKLKTHPGSWPKIGRFLFESYIDGKRKMTYSDKLPELELTDATPSTEPKVSWQQKVVQTTSRTGQEIT